MHLIQDVTKLPQTYIEFLRFVWYNVGERVRMVLIRSVIEKESERNNKMISEYETLLKQLPRGSLICRRNGYYYLKYREGGKLNDVYIGKDGDVVTELKEQLELRKHYTLMLSVLRKEQKSINDILEGLA